MTAFSPRPANSQVSLARRIGLQKTSLNGFAARSGRIRSATRRPLSVKGDIGCARVLPGKAPFRLSVPDREHVHLRLPDGSNVIGLCRADAGGSRFLSPPPAGDLGHVVAVTGYVFLVIDELVANGLLRVRRPRR